MSEPRAPGRAQSIPELTLRVVILGIVLSVVMSAANVYLGLKLGMTVSASIPAAVIASLILRQILGNGTVLEANQVQTAASAGESLAAGIIFTVPAIVLIGYWQAFDFWTTSAIAFAGGLLGILFMIPMRKVFISDEASELKFPEGVACAAVLEAGGEGGADAAEQKSDGWRIVAGAAWGFAINGAVEFLALIKSKVAFAAAAGERIFYVGTGITPALIAVGFIVRLNIAALLFIGGAIGWLVAIPLIGATEAQLADPLAGADEIWDSQIRFLGVGAMVVGGLDAIYKVRGGLARAIATLRDRSPSEGASEDIPTGLIAGVSLIATAVIAWVYYQMTGDVGMTALTTVVMVLMSFFFTAVASYIVGLVGNSNSPVSGMTITAVLFTGGLLLLFGYTGIEGMAATLGVAAIVCCAACTSGDVCNDLKTGQIVGASPRRQQIMQIVGVGVACLVMAPFLQLFHDDKGIGSDAFPAPQAKLFQSLVEGFFGDAVIPWDMVGWGAALGVTVLIVDRVLAARDSGFRAHLMPLAVGVYLPFYLAPPILFGGLVAHMLARGLDEEAAERRLRPGVLLASGAIAGEAFAGIGSAVMGAFALEAPALGLPGWLTMTLTFAALVGTLAIFHRFGRRG